MEISQWEISLNAGNGSLSDVKDIFLKDRKKYSVGGANET